jgi:hypothetical protein
MRPTHLCSGLVLAAASAVLAASPAAAQDYSPWSVGISIGQDVSVSGDAVTGATGRSVALGTLNSNLTGNGQIVMRGTGWDDAFDKADNISVEVRYAASDMSEFFGAVTYTEAEGRRNVAIGCITVAATGCQTDLVGSFTDFKQIGVEAGYRQWFGVSLLGDSLKPYWAVRGGLVRTDEIRLNVATTTVGGIGDWRLYEEGWTAMIGADIGATYAISPNAEIGGEIGVRYVTKLGDDDSDFGALGLGSINDESERLSVPVSVRLNAVF